MGTEPIVESQTGSYRYEAIVRISETIAACREPEEMATTLASEIGKFLHFDHLYFVVLKENSTEIEYLLWGKSQSLCRTCRCKNCRRGPRSTAETRSILLIGMQRNDFPDSGNTQRKYGSARASAFH